MKTIDIIAELNRIVDMLPDDDKKLYDFARSNPSTELAKLPCSLACALGALANRLEADALMEAAKAANRGTQLKALNRIVKCAANAGRENYAGAFETASGARAVCDGYRAVRITNSGVAMPRAAKGGMNIDKIIDDFAGLENVPAELPAATQLKTELRIAEAERKAKYGRNANKRGLAYRVQAGGVVSYFNPHYIVDALEALPGADVYLACSDLPTLYLKSADGDAIVMPVRYSAAHHEVMNCA